MKFKIIFTLLTIFARGSYSYAQSADVILGIWQSEHGSGRIQVFKEGESYNGRIVWLKDEKDESGKPKTDINNPSEALKSQPIKGLEVLSDFTYSDNGEWEGGTVYDPRSGKKYSCKLSLSGNGQLEIRAFKGISLIGKTQVWSRVK
ncbi:DUF2147 domain-containing protein [Daejeonella sp. JGW-45]|uniref:DUF2147 domain-containing protein n=1 Tax=Daejeonella sp. JGW-45 TaxID=3034148 RepID=UPI0023EE207C|nr:DUF2147 domain-containing protein [Daejeonella sp. JGW-45]